MDFREYADGDGSTEESLWHFINQDINMETPSDPMIQGLLRDREGYTVEDLLISVNNDGKTTRDKDKKGENMRFTENVHVFGKGLKSIAEQKIPENILKTPLASLEWGWHSSSEMEPTEKKTRK